MRLLRTTKQQGFTIIELMIATTVFSVILLICSFAMLQIGRTYYKGITQSRTQNVARTVIDDISQSIQFSGGTLAAGTAAGTPQRFCIDNKVYYYRLNYQLGKTTAPDNYALKLDKVPVCPAIPSVGAAVGGKELLGPNMQLDKFTVIESPAGSGLWQVTVRIVYGDDAVLTGSSGSHQCRENRAGGQFCAVSELTTVVQKRI